jgi:hypothetical protein
MGKQTLVARDSPVSTTFSGHLETHKRSNENHFCLVNSDAYCANRVIKRELQAKVTRPELRPILCKRVIEMRLRTKYSRQSSARRVGYGLFTHGGVING